MAIHGPFFEKEIMGSVEVFSQQLDRESDSAASLCTSSSSSSSSLTATLKPSYSFHPEPSRQSRCCTLGVVVLALHILLWTSVFVLASTVYIFLSSPPTSQYLLPEALLLSCSSSSIVYVALHTATAYLQSHPFASWMHQAMPTMRVTCTTLMCGLVAVWTATCGIIVTITVETGTICPLEPREQQGKSCALGTATLVASFIALVSSLNLIVVLVFSNRPFAQGIFGLLSTDTYPTTQPSNRQVDVGEKGDASVPRLRSDISNNPIEAAAAPWVPRSRSHLSTAAPIAKSQHRMTMPASSVPPTSQAQIGRLSLLSARPSLASIHSAAASIPLPRVVEARFPILPIPAHVRPAQLVSSHNRSNHRATRGPGPSKERRCLLRPCLISSFPPPPLECNPEIEEPTGYEEMKLPPSMRASLAIMGLAAAARSEISLGSGSSVYSCSISGEDKDVGPRHLGMLARVASPLAMG